MKSNCEFVKHVDFWHWYPSLPIIRDCNKWEEEKKKRENTISLVLFVVKFVLKKASFSSCHRKVFQTCII